MFLKGIKLVHVNGQACPTRECRFLEYEDLPLYDPMIKPPPCMFPTRHTLLTASHGIIVDMLID
jgi:hypothetical protein